MAKKKSWFNIVKRFFISETKPNTPEKKGKRKIWLFGRLKNKRYPAITAPTASKDRALSEAEEEQSKNAMTVAIAAAADANADVVAGEVAGEIVRVNGASQSTGECERTKEELQMEIRIEAPQSTSILESAETKIQTCEKEILESAETKIQTCEKEILESASVRIQTAFRGYLARKALRALKGIVRLQALIRGRNVRRQAINTLKCLQSIVNIQTQVRAKRSEKGSWLPDENKELQTLRDKIINVMDLNSQRRWDDSTLTKAEADAMFQSKKEAILKRERIKEYLFQHRRSAESERNKPNGRWRYWLDQWVDTQLSKSKELEDLDSIWTSSNTNPMQEQKGKGLRLKNLQRQNHNEELNSPVLLLPGRSFHRKQTSLGDHENSFSTSPVVPTYMAATESAKAKARSLSSPRTRPGSYYTSSDSHSPYKNKLCLVSSVTNDMSSRGKIGRSSAYQQRSPSLKGFQGPVKSSKTVNDLSINSECSLLNLDGQSLLR